MVYCRVLSRVDSVDDLPGMRWNSLSRDSSLAEKVRLCEMLELAIDEGIHGEKGWKAMLLTEVVRIMEDSSE